MSYKKTIPYLFQKVISKDPFFNLVGWCEGEHFKKLTAKKLSQHVTKLAAAILELNLPEFSKIAVLSHSRKEWHFSDMAIQLSRNCTIPIYPTYIADEVAYILNHSESEVIFIENEGQFKKVIDVQDDLKTLKTIVSFENISQEHQSKLKDDITFLDYKELLIKGDSRIEENDELFEELYKKVQEDDLCTIIYTSGTTGEPKGAAITQKAFYTMLKNLEIAMNKNIDRNDRNLVFLPMSHVLGRCDSYLYLIFQNQTVYAESIEKVLDNIQLVKPSVFIAVPRIFEKIYSKIQLKVAESSPAKRKLFQWAVEVSNKYFSKLDQDLSPTTLEIAQKNLAYNLVFKKIYKQFGGNVRFFISGGAPISSEIIKFLRNANLLILEGYGLTETCGPICINPISKQELGTVGLPVGEVQIRFSDKNEILLKSDCIFTEYYKNPDATKESFTEDNWFKTGDIGEITQSGFLKITDRMKDIIITSGGKNIAPQKIENLMKNQSFISQFMVVGEGRKFLAGVVGIEKENFLSQLEEMSLDQNCSIEELAKSERVQELIKGNLEAVNSGLARYESIKKIFISPVELSLDNGFLTPSMKLKKKVIYNKFKDEIDALYQ